MEGTEEWADRLKLLLQLGSVVLVQVGESVVLVQVGESVVLDEYLTSTSQCLLYRLLTPIYLLTCVWLYCSCRSSGAMSTIYIYMQELWCKLWCNEYYIYIYAGALVQMSNPIPDCIIQK